MGDNTPLIGIFDSGIGGLSVLQHIRADLSQETLLYVADSGYAPYGNKPAEWIVQRSFAITEFLRERQAKAVVVACNTATAVAVAQLRDHFDMPIIGIEPAIKPAVTMTNSGVIGILATGNTVHSDKFINLLDRHSQQARVLVQPCPGLAECVERGELEGIRPLALLKRYLEPLLQHDADTLVLGCTHYPFLMPLIRQIVGAEMTILDPGPAVARQLRRKLEAADLLAIKSSGDAEHYFSSGEPERTAAVITRLLGYPVHLDTLPGRFMDITPRPAIPASS